MKRTLNISAQGMLSLHYDGICQIQESPIGLLIHKGKRCDPIGAAVCADRICVNYEPGDVTLVLEEKAGYAKLTVAEVPEDTDVFMFGPYFVNKPQYGDILGSAFDDETAVCIQSLNPKTMGGTPEKYVEAHPFYGKDRIPPFSRGTFLDSAAVPVSGGVILQCYAQDMTKPTHTPQFENKAIWAQACEVPGEDAYIKGASIALICCRASELLDEIGALEVAEGLPHPTIDGVWAKKSPRATESYMMIWQDKDSFTYEESLELVKKAGLHCFYSWGPFVSWGHFEIDPAIYAGGDAGLKKAVDQAAEKGLMCGFHTLSNFIHTHDPYVSPIPSEDLLVMDTTTLTHTIGAEDTELTVAEQNNFHIRTHLNVVRIGRELIQFKTCKPCKDGYILTELKRGAFGTAKEAHAAGEPLYRLQDHGYQTVFPNLHMQHEMAARVGELIKNTGIRRMSFDGMEGCLYTGRGEYACSEYVRRVYEVAGSELLSDASIPSHYRWHAHSYHNWGEPYYDYQGRGGMFQYRIHNQEFFRRNLIPGMLGQYAVRLATDKFEATHPENFEFTMAQTVANNAGMGFDVTAKVLKGHGLTDYLLERVRIWEDMRFHGVIPEKLREDMKDENANWHLEAQEDGWKVQKLRLQTYDFGYRESVDGEEHCELVMIDRAVPQMTLQMRIRVGQKRQKGQLTYLAFHNGWGGFDPNLRFENIAADAGDYLIYTGGTSIKHYDANYNFLEEIEGIGQEVSVGGEIAGVDVHWIRSEDSGIEPFATVFQAVEETEIPRRRENA